MSIELIEELKKVNGALPYDGDASVQVLLPTIDGRILRVGVTDNDVSEAPDKVWFDYYKGLNEEIKNLKLWIKLESHYDLKNQKKHEFLVN